MVWVAAHISAEPNRKCPLYRWGKAVGDSCRCLFLPDLNHLPEKGDGHAYTSLVARRANDPCAVIVVVRSHRVLAGSSKSPPAV